MTNVEPKWPLHVLFVFLDGIGLGADDEVHNPFCLFDLPTFNSLIGGNAWTQSAPTSLTETHVFKGIDATLGIPGLPQSGTGQATLFTGINCAEVAGRHFGPYPHSKTKPVLSEENIFRKISNLTTLHPEPVAFANAYPKQFFEKAQSKNRWTVTTYSCIEANVPIRSLKELRRNAALTADLTRKAWNSKLRILVEEINEDEAARHLFSISQNHLFTLFEYYLTDKAGHSQSMEKAGAILTSLDRFLDQLLSCVEQENVLLIITSDHGNLEDLSHKSHTMNPVPLLVTGNGSQHFHEVDTIADVTPALVNVIKEFF